MNFYEGTCDNVDHKNQIVNVVYERAETASKSFKLNYDYLVLGLGAQINTFGIKGVDTYAAFLKELEHATQIRVKLIHNFEMASLPSTTEEEVKRLLHFVIVGGGPTGVEAAAEFSDFIKQDMGRHFPNLMPFVSISLIEALPKLLPMYSESVSSFTASVFKDRLKVNLLLQHAVTEITATNIIVKNLVKAAAGDKDPFVTMPYGFVLWASGVAQVPLARKLIDSIEAQKGARVLKVDEMLRVKGVKNIYAMVDCSWLEPPPLAAKAHEYYLQAASEGGASTAWLESKVEEFVKRYPQISPSKFNLKEHANKTFTETTFSEFLQQIDKAYKPPVPTAQNAKQAGEYLAKTFNTHFSPDAKAHAPAFVETWRGSLAYVGAHQAVATSPKGDMLGGMFSLPIWKFAYTTLLLSWRSRAICVFDWLRIKCLGRDVGRDRV